MKYLCPKEGAAQFGISERTVRRMMAAGYIQAFRIGTKLWRTDQASLDDYINTGQYGRYRRQLGPLRPMPDKRDDLVPARKLEIHLVGEADEHTNCVAEIGRICPIPQLTANHTQKSQSVTSAQVPVCPYLAANHTNWGLR
jgi:excisionase family DNA binding protein